MELSGWLFFLSLLVASIPDQRLFFWAIEKTSLSILSKKVMSNVYTLSVCSFILLEAA